MINACSNKDCKVLETGKCVEGLIIADCPHQINEALISSNVVVPIIHSNIPETVKSENLVFLSSGESLAIQDATILLQKRKSKVLTIIGPFNSGKTTLSLSIYEALQQKDFHGWHFAGSQTLASFEKRCHDSRLASGRSQADTPRTSGSDGLGFSHLALHKDDCGCVNLLISDRAGEFYTAVGNGTEKPENAFEVSRADCILFLVDGGKFATNEKHAVRTEILMLLESFVQSGVINKSHTVGIVLTKLDIVRQSADFAIHEKSFDDFVLAVHARFDLKIREIFSFKISARPQAGSLEGGHGVEAIVDLCMTDRPILHSVGNHIEISRSFSKFGNFRNQV